jgi:hypothetical protein
LQRLSFNRAEQLGQKLAAVNGMARAVDSFALAAGEAEPGWGDRGVSLMSADITSSSGVRQVKIAVPAA